MLLLGSSETIARHDGLFAPLEKEHRIFQRRDVPSPAIKVPARLIQNAAPTVPVSRPARRSSGARAGPIGRTPWLLRIAGCWSGSHRRSWWSRRTATIMHYSSHVGKLPAAGARSTQPKRVRHGEARPASWSSHAALRSGSETGRAVEQTVPGEATVAARRLITLFVEPLPGQEPDRPYLVVFKEAKLRKVWCPPRPPALTPARTSVSRDGARAARHSGSSCNRLAEEHETALEELRSANEELHSVNEELQSSNEELETSKEEIQSINEELQHRQCPALQQGGRAGPGQQRSAATCSRARSVATVFLDQHMVIRAFTPEVASIYNLIPSDRGRPLTDIVSRLDYDGLREDVQQVLHTLEPLERRVSRRDGTAHYLLRILPYRRRTARWTARW